MIKIAYLLWEPHGYIDHIEAAVNDYSYIFFFSFEQRKKGKETVLSMGIIHRSRGNWMWIWSKIMI